MRRPYNGTYSITRPFGVYDAAYANYPGSRHPGCDYGLPYRTPLIAAISGTAQVIDRGTAKTGRGREVVITNGSTQVKYCHMDSFSISNGQQVSEGQVVGHSGFTGYVMDSAGNIGTIGGTHLHFETLINGVYQNPENQYNQGGNMADKTNLNTARILGETILGRDRNLTHSGKGDADLNANHVNRDLTNDYVYKLWTSPEAQAAAAREASYKKFYDTYSSKIAELSVRPTKEELAKLGESLKAEQAKVVAAEKKLAEEQAKKTEDTVLLDEAGNWLTKLFNRIFKKG